MDERLFTYHDLAAHFTVTVRTIGRWFAGRPGVVCVTPGTVRVPESVVTQFKQEKTLKPKIINANKIKTSPKSKRAAKAGK